MPRVDTRKTDRAAWSQEDLNNAMHAVIEDKVKIREAGRRFNIPERTLRRRLISRNFEKRNLGPSSCLGYEAEKKLVSHIEKLQAAGFAPNRKTVQKLAYDLAVSCGIPHKFNNERQRAGRDWFKSFMERNVNLSLRKAEGISVLRAQGMNREEVNKYFDLLTATLQEHGLMGKPGNVFNVDESGLQLNNKPDKVIAVKGSKDLHVLTSGEKGETISVIACTNAEGSFLPPYCIFKGVNRKPEYSDGMPPGSIVTMSKKSAYVTSEIFMDWLENHFLPRKPAGKTLLILDGHASHMNCFKMLEFCVLNDIILLCLPSHTTHYLQPLDRSYFKPLKTYFYQACQKWMLANENRKITRFQFGALLSSVWSLAATVANGVAGFRGTGIFPLDRSAIPDHAFRLSESVGVPSGSTSINYQNHQVSDEASLSQQLVDRPVSPKQCSTVGPSSSRPVILHNKAEVCQSPVDPQLTPNKALSVISPIPVMQARKNSKRKQSAAILTEPDFISGKKSKISARQTAGKCTPKQLMCNKTESKGKPRLRKRKISSSSSDSSSFSVACSGQSELSEENECVECLEEYEKTTSSADWIKCVICSRWLHETCTIYCNMCSVCGRMEKRKNWAAKKR
ncbi:uncharacterized protein LOC134533020 isoform X1 [Bacillus rossius redtenbacheri]|uniref:uncharacterized protein LOC134533020 isoform X1 n=1 Tax=Bacillus rossius redtenbacheri TaxID=93214 RepID=UPI002FDEF2C4